MAITPPQKRGTNTRRTGTTAITSMAASCSPAFMRPISAVSEVPARPAKSSAVTTGPSSRVKDRRSEEHTSELQSRGHLVCGLLLEKKKKTRAAEPTDDRQRAQDQ